MLTLKLFRKCGATVFWHCDERPGLIDVSVGLIEASKEGVRAEGWIDWFWSRVSFEEEGENIALLEKLKKGLKAWGTGGVDDERGEA